MLTDLDELVLRCRTERAKEHIRESLVSYRAGAYRAAIVTCWIAVVFDIVDKVRDLALTNDAKAKAVVAKLDQYLEQLRNGNQQAISAALEFERTILDVANKDFLLLDAQQFLDLSRLREDRNRCAHPTFQSHEDVYRPSGELARLHIANAITHMLSQPPVQGKAAADQVEQLILSDYFPSKTNLAKDALQETALARPTDSLVRLLVDRLLFGTFENGPHRFRRQSLAALQAILEMHPQEAETRLRTQMQKILSHIEDKYAAHAIGLIHRFRSALENSLTNPQKEKLRNYLKDKKERPPALAIKWALELGFLRSEALLLVQSSSVDELNEIIQRGANEDFTSRALTLLTEANEPSAAVEIIEGTITPLSKVLTPEQVATVASFAEDMKVNSTDEFQSFLKALRKSHPTLKGKNLDQFLAAQKPT